MPVSRGLYTDNTGAKHRWNVNAAHTLQWDDQPFVPVGGLFQVRSWTSTATDADWNSDVTALQTLKAKNLTDIYVQPARGGLTSVKPEAVQRMLDYLDQQGFTYGISINDGPKDFLSGYVVRPGAYWQKVPEDGGPARFAVENLASAWYFMVNKESSDVIRNGDATMVAEGARVELPAIPGDFSVFLVPRRVYFPRPADTGGIGLPDLWGGFDAYRDALLNLFQQVKPGKGFRFFLDALPPDLSISSGEATHLVPDGAGFRSEWEEWLTRRYKNVDSLQRAWSLSDREVMDFRQAARLVPLWSGDKGFAAFHDPQAERPLRADSRRSEFWRDLERFKALSVRGYMNDLTTSLKRTVADVPVVYRSRGWSPLFAGGSLNATGLPLPTYDGVGIEAYGRGKDLVTTAAGEVYAQAAETNKTLWLPVVATADAPAAQKTAKGYTSRTTLHSDLDWLRGIGARGFYVNGLRVAEASRKVLDLSDVPESLDWLADYGRMLVATGVKTADTVPKAVFYPRNLPAATLRPLSGGIWWLPTDRAGTILDFGPVGRAYAMYEEGAGMVYYLYNPLGTRRIHLKIPKASRDENSPTRVAWSESAQGEMDRKKGILALTIGPDPIRILNLANLPVPIEAFDELLAETQALAKKIRSGKSMEAGRYELELSAIRARRNEEQPYLSLSELLGLRSRLQNAIRDYAWIEAEGLRERPTPHTFDETADRAGASGGRVLVVDPRAVGAPVATASYTLTARETSVYQVWVAASPNAPISLRLDGHSMLDNAELPKPTGALYANGTLQWVHLGTATLPKGSHLMELRADGPAAVDVILLTREPFTPDGPNPPPLNP